MQKYCTNCGAKLSEGLKFCTSCGVGLPAEITRDNTGETGRKAEPAAVLPHPESGGTRPGAAGPDVVAQKTALISDAEYRPVKRCANCGAVLSDELRFCTACGQKSQKAPAEPKDTTLPGAARQNRQSPPSASPEAAFRQDPPAEATRDPKAEQILSKYGRKNLLVGSFLMVVATAVLYVVFPYFRVLIITFAAYTILSGPTKSYQYRVAALRKLGLAKQQIDALLVANPLLFPARPGGKRRTVSIVLAVLGWVIFVYGLFAVLLPVTVAIVSGFETFNKELLLKGIQIFIIGLTAINVGRAVKGV